MSNEANAKDTVLLTLDTEACIGVGQCELLEPTVFRLDDDDNISVFVGKSDLRRDRAEIVVDKCPSGAIQIAEEN